MVEFCDVRMKSARMDFVGELGPAMIVGDCRAVGEVFRRGSWTGESPNARLNGLDGTEETLMF